MTDAFEIKDGELLLKYNGQRLIELKPTDKKVNLKAIVKAEKVKKSEESLPPKKTKGAIKLKKNQRQSKKVTNNLAPRKTSLNLKVWAQEG